MTPDSRTPRTISLALVAVTLATFAPGLRGGFVWDDHDLIERNPALHTAAGLARALTRHFWDVQGLQGASAGEVNRYYRPVVTLAYAAQWWAFGGHPAGFHSVSLALHIGCVLLAWTWLRRRLGDSPVASVSAPVSASVSAALGAALFALHPSRPESVSWISGSTDLWMTLGVLAALVAWDRGRDALAALALVLALLAKETAVVVPALLALDALLLAPSTLQRRQRLGRAGAVALVLALAAAARFALVPPRGANLHTAGALARTAATLGEYARCVVWRWPASAQLGLVLYDDRLRPILAPWSIAVGAAVLAAAGALAVAAARRPALRPWLADAAWFLLPLAPVLNVGDMRLRALGQPHDLYLPLLGVTAAAARAATRVPAAWRRASLGVAITVLAASAATCAVRSVVLGRDASLWAAEFRAEPRNPNARREQIADADARGRFREARDLAAEGYTLCARYHLAEVVDFPALAAEAEMNRCTDADSACLRGVRTFLEDLARPGVTARLTYDTGGITVLPGQPWRASLATHGHYAVSLAVAEARAGDLAAAEATLRPAARPYPMAAPVWGTLALVLAREERWADARRALAEARALSPDPPRIAGLAARIDRGAALSAASVGAADPVTAGALRAQMFMALGAPVLARRVAAALDAAHPDHPELALLRAQIDVADRRFDLARSEVLAARARDPADAARWDRVLEQLAAAETTSHAR